MIELDHRFVVVGGLFLACLFYRVPLYAILFVIVCAFAVYVRNKYKDGFRFALFGGNGFGFIRQTKHGRYRQPTPLSSTILTPNQDFKLTHKDWSSNSLFHSSGRRSALSRSNTSSVSTPKCRLDQHNYDGSQRFFNQSLPFQSRLSSPSFPSDMGRPRHRTSVYDVPNTNNRGKTDSTFVGMDGVGDETRQPKYSGVGTYPLVQLEPCKPALLSHCNSSMIKNRVTVKVALPERQNFNQSLKKSHAVNFASPPQGCSTVVEALNTTRKRPLKDDGSNSTEHSANKRRHQQSENDHSVPHLPSEIAQHFQNQLSDESFAILSQPTKTVAEVHDQLAPATVRQAQTNAIHSSYSSSLRFEKSVAINSAKRKPRSACEEARNFKMVRSNSPTPQEEGSSTAAKQEGEEVQDVNSPEKLTLLADEISKVPPQDEKPPSYSFHTTMTGARNPMPIHVPTYIPSLEDYIEDKKAERERLEKILGRFTIVNANKNEEVSSSGTSSVSTSTNVDSSFKITQPPVDVVSEVTTTQSDNETLVPSIVTTTSAASTMLPTSILSLLATSTTNVERELTETPPPPINFPVVPTTAVDKQLSDGPNSITSSFSVPKQQQEAATSLNKVDSSRLTFAPLPSLGMAGICRQSQPTSIASTLTTSQFSLPTVAPLSFSAASQNSLSLTPSLQFKGSKPAEQTIVSDSPFTFGLKPQDPNSLAISESQKQSSVVGTGMFSFGSSATTISTAVAAASGQPLFSNVSSPFSGNQIASAVTTTAAVSETTNLNNVNQFSIGGKPTPPTFGEGFTFGQNCNPSKTEPLTFGGQSNAPSAFQFGNPSSQSSNPFGNATQATFTTVPTFGTTSPAFGSNATTNGMNVGNMNGETTNGGGQFASPFSFGVSVLSNQPNNVFAFGNATPSLNNNNCSSSFAVPSAPQGFNFSSSSKPSFNFGASPAAIPGTPAAPNMNIFSVGPSNTTTTSARRSKHPPQRHRYHR